MTNINHSLSVQFAEFLFSQNIAKISTKVNFLLYAEQYYMLSLPANFPRVDKKIFKVYFNFSYVYQNFTANLGWDCGNKFFFNSRSTTDSSNKTLILKNWPCRTEKRILIMFSI